MSDHGDGSAPSLLELADTGLYLQPTPAGAYYAVGSPEMTPERRLLLVLMSSQSSRRPTMADFCQWTQQRTEQDALAVVFRAQERGWLEGFRQPQGPPPGPLEPIAARTLPALSSSGHGLLADAQGFCIASRGFDSTASDFLAAVSADIASMHERHAAYLADASGTATGAWALVDMAGNSRVGFWPLFIGDHRFVLALGGLPALNHPALVELVWSLTFRYGGPELAATPTPGRQAQ
ncbi:MAG: hypothetical protein GYA65_18265 [Actinobacteria bacterium]|nr:hypothetical protein [Ilumatobacteraceae bacterium]MBP8210805.1 hypothetical protein [Ilumatobacteraceae bacterium]MBP9052352.1 hypothetical protein [Ilumatobacteraceae bacterium]NMD26120.1 hypothetical protein [Actinomycetota bacterium]